MACGVPVLGSVLDGSREALRDGALGVLVDPSDRQGLCDGIIEVLQRTHGVPEKVRYFDRVNLEIRLARALSEVIREGSFKYTTAEVPSSNEAL
jgi:glycosyltransferase involved in cell wall biosynthesis